MPKTVKPQTPGAVLQSFIDEYQITQFYLSKQVHLSNAQIQNIVKEKSKITVQTAIRLAQYFGNSPKFWLDIQIASEIDELSNNKTFLSEIKSIPKAVKPKDKAKPVKKAKTATKTVKRKLNTLAEKHKTAAKVPGVKAPKKCTQTRTV